MSPRPPEKDLESVEFLEKRVSILQRENAEFTSVNDVLQTNTAINMTEREDLEAHLKRLGEAVLGMLTVLSNNSLIVVKDGLVVPEHVSVEGLNPPSATAEVEEAKKEIDLEVMILRREFDVIKNMHQKASCEEQNKDKHIENLSKQIKKQKEQLLNINTEQVKLREDHEKTEEELKVAKDRCNTLNSEKKKLEVTLNELMRSLIREQRLRAEILSEKSKAEAEFKKIKAIITELQKRNFYLEALISQQSTQNSDLAININGEHIDMSKLRAFKDQCSDGEQVDMSSLKDPKFQPLQIMEIDDKDIHYKETKTQSVATTDKYYDYSGPQTDIMKRLSLESLSKYFSFIDDSDFFYCRS